MDKHELVSIMAAVLISGSDMGDEDTEPTLKVEDAVQWAINILDVAHKQLYGTPTVKR